MTVPMGTPGQPPHEQGPTHLPPAFPPAGSAPRGALPTTPRGPANPRDPRLTVDAGRYWAGGIATALVAALIGLIGVIVFERVLSIALVPPPDLSGSDSHQTAFALDGALLAIVATGVLHLLIVTTPRPRAFFGWIMALVLVVVAVLPFVWTGDTLSAAMSGLVNVTITAAVWSLLAGVAGRTIVRTSA